MRLGGGLSRSSPESSSRGESRHPKALARLELAGSALSFGLMAVLARRLSRSGFSAGQLSVIRFGVGALVLLAAFAVRPGLYRPRSYPRLIARGVSGGIVVVLYFWALGRIPAAEAGLLYNLFPVIASAMSVVALGERPTIHLLIALLAATVAVALVLGRGSLDVRLGAGELAALAAALFGALSAILIRGMRESENAATIFFFFCLAGLPVVAPFALQAWSREAGPWALAVCMALSAVAAQVLMTDAYGALRVTEAAVWLQLTPIAQATLAFALLGEPVSAGSFAGILLGVAAVAYGTAFGRARRAPPIAPPPS